MLRAIKYFPSKFSLSRKYGSVTISAEVQEALNNKWPVVALESTIITHGMPFPRNIEVAMMVENKVRENGAVPATVALINGDFHVGLTSVSLQKLAQPSAHEKICKVSRRDLAAAAAVGGTGGTTVAATMILAERAGIKIFATGGIGGVHRGAEMTMDVSADLMELGKTPICVVCAGVKSILDIPKTLEVLETQGVPVVGYNCDIFPAFFTNNSGVKSPIIASSPETIAKMILLSGQLNLRNGMIVGVPNPSPGNSEDIQAAIDSALASAAEENVLGAAITPFVLDKVEKLTGGKSLEANIALILNNAKIASLIAVELSRLQISDNQRVVQSKVESDYIPSSSNSIVSTVHSSRNITSVDSSAAAPSVSAKTAPLQTTGSSDEPSILVFGGAVIDLIAKSAVPLVGGSSNPGQLGLSFGGVGRNIAEALARLGRPASLVSAVGNDSNGQLLLMHAAQAGVDVSKVKIVGSAAGDGGGAGSVESVRGASSEPVAGLNVGVGATGPSSPHSASSTGGGGGAGQVGTATYTAVHDTNGDLFVGIADMEVLKLVDPDTVLHLAGAVRHSRLVVTDGNLREDSYLALLKLTRTYAIPVFFEPTSDHKCLLPISTKTLHELDIVKPNVSELVTMVEAANDQGWILRGKSAVSGALSRARRLASTDVVSTIDVTDVRILAFALQGLMANPGSILSSSSNSSSNSSSDATNVKHSSRHSRTSSGSGSGSGVGPAQITAEGWPRKVRGKHVIVTLGARGALWCGPKEAVLRTRSDDPRLDPRELAELKERIVALDDATSCRHFPAHPVAPGSVLNASGAGDTFCAGVISAMYSLDCQELDGKCIECGLRAASLSVASSSPVPTRLAEVALEGGASDATA